jgi:hypothetical protein
VYVINMNEFDATTSLIRETLAAWQSIAITANGAKGAEAAASRPTYGEKHGGFVCLLRVRASCAASCSQRRSETLRASRRAASSGAAFRSKSRSFTRRCALSSPRASSRSPREGPTGWSRCGAGGRKAERRRSAAVRRFTPLLSLASAFVLVWAVSPPRALAVTQRSLARSLAPVATN